MPCAPRPVPRCTSRGASAVSDALEVSDAILAAIVAHARRAAPEECCGLLVGEADRIVEAIPTPNIATDRQRRYVIDPRDHFDVIRAARQRGNTVLGAYHSHPCGAAIPSETDRLEAFGGFVFIIVGLAGEPPEVTAWHWESGNFRPLVLVGTRKGRDA